MIAVIDNYDSFTYNLVQMVGKLSPEVQVFRNDAITAEELRKLHPRGIIISPGPGRPEKAGNTMDIVRTLGMSIPILGVCLGHQAVGAVFGGRIVHAPELVHGKASKVFHTGKGIFQNIENPFIAGRYHSLVISSQNLPEELEVLAYTEDNIIMALQHKSLPIIGVQFHPESILTPIGQTILANWLGGLSQ
jgi:anthranilate synthase component 2